MGCDGTVVFLQCEKLAPVAVSVCRDGYPPVLTRQQSWDHFRHRRDMPPRWSAANAIPTPTISGSPMRKSRRFVRPVVQNASVGCPTQRLKSLDSPCNALYDPRGGDAPLNSVIGPELR